MVQSTSPSTGGQAGAVRDQFAQQTGLPFLDVLSASEVESTCRARQPQLEEQDLHPVDHSEYVPVADPFLRSFL